VRLRLLKALPSPTCSDRTDEQKAAIARARGQPEDDPGREQSGENVGHQLAAAHHASMAPTAQLNRCIENMKHHDPDARERANIQIAH
jgi:hypothetical protein